jgi:putative endonuclease
MYLVYILKCNDGSLYIGSTNNLQKRLHEHNHLKSGAHYTKIRRPVEIVYTEDVGDISSARKREASLKKLTREEKLLLILSKNTDSN